MRTVRIIPRRPILLALFGCVALVGACVGWIAIQNERYESRVETANKPVMDALRRRPTGFDEKNALVAKHYPGVVNTVQIPEVIFRTVMLPDMRGQLDVMRALDPPLLWRSYHGSLVTFQRARVAALEAQYAQMKYAGEFLGEGESIERIAALATDPKYVALGRDVRRSFVDSGRAAASFNAAEPRIASWLPGSPDEDVDVRMKANSLSTNEVSNAAICARAELDGKPAPLKDCASMLRYVPERPGCAIDIGYVESPCRASRVQDT